MGREVRKVPPYWQHPEGKGLMAGPYSKAVAEWDEAKTQWDAGFQRDYSVYPDIAWKPLDEEYRRNCETWAEESEFVDSAFEEAEGERPLAEDYMPEWSDNEATHYMMYETTSEGSSISPAFATVEELARWLADTGASAFGHDTAAYDQWLATCRCGFAPSAVVTVDADGDTHIQSGVAAIERLR